MEFFPNLACLTATILMPLHLHITKGQSISKANCQAVNSSKKRTNEFSFTTMQHVFVRFLEEIEAGQDRNNLFLKVLDTQWCSFDRS